MENDPFIKSGSSGRVFTSHIILISFLATIMFIITGFVLLALTIMFIVRVITLIFLMILSPIGFVAAAIPGLSSQGTRWWKTLTNNIIFAPLVLLCILISIAMLQHGIKDILGIGVGSDQSILAGASADTSQLGGWANLLLVFAIATGFMLASLMIARQLSMAGANFAVNTSKRIVSAPFNFVGSKTMRGVGWGARGVGNWYNAKSGQLATSDSRVARGISKTARFIGLDQGISKGLQKTQEVKVGGYASYTERRKEDAEYAKTTAHAAETANLRNALQTGDTEHAAEIATKMNLHTLEEAIKEMGTEIAAKLGDSEVLSPEKFAKLMDSKEINDDVKDQMRKHRFSNVVSDATDPDHKDANELSIEDMVQLSKFNKEYVEQLIKSGDAEGRSGMKEDLLDAVGKNKDVSDDLRKLARDNSAAKRVELNIESTDKVAKTAAVNLYEHMNSEERLKVKTKVVVANKELLHEENPATTNLRLSKGSLNQEQMDTIAENSVNGPNAHLYDAYAAADKTGWMEAQLGRSRYKKPPSSGLKPEDFVT
jgi:hypothetical protein